MYSSLICLVIRATAGPGARGPLWHGNAWSAAAASVPKVSRSHPSTGSRQTVAARHNDASWRQPPRTLTCTAIACSAPAPVFASAGHGSVVTVLNLVGPTQGIEIHGEGELEQVVPAKQRANTLPLDARHRQWWPVPGR